MDEHQLYQILPVGLADLGEGPVWDDRLNRLLWVDIVAGNVHEWYVGSRRHVVTHFPVKIGAIALTEKEALIAASSKGFVFLDLAERKITEIADPESQLINNRFNDGKCDPSGRFWAGTMDDVTGQKEAGALYRLGMDLGVTKMIDDVTCSNGLAWSLDGKTLYFIDTGTRQVKAFDFENDTGNIANGRIVILIPESEGIPDGMTIDNEGMLWIALWGGWKVARWNPITGEKLDEIALPVSQVTSCTFGGSNYDDLYITSAAIGLSEENLAKQPHAGSLFVVKDVPYGGMEAVRFATEWHDRTAR